MLRTSSSTTRTFLPARLESLLPEPGERIPLGLRKVWLGAMQQQYGLFQQAVGCAYDPNGTHSRKPQKLPPHPPEWRYGGYMQNDGRRVGSRVAFSDVLHELRHAYPRSTDIDDDSVHPAAAELRREWREKLERMKSLHPDRRAPLAKRHAETLVTRPAAACGCVIAARDEYYRTLRSGCRG